MGLIPEITLTFITREIGHPKLPNIVALFGLLFSIALGTLARAILQISPISTRILEVSTNLPNWTSFPGEKPIIKSTKEIWSKVSVEISCSNSRNYYCIPATHNLRR
ncbi:MAG: hypothetical protein OSB05_06150 [Akkermansiaceae bacterium]|nr:hypothetical protein [Akkermansiaceae bacterium]